VPFSLSSSLGAGAGKRTQKPLGAHEGGIWIAMKENTAVSNLQPNYVSSCFGNSTPFTSLLHQCIIFISHRTYHNLFSLLHSTNKKNFSPK
jgi:hypothetical protein